MPTAIIARPAPSGDDSVTSRCYAELTMIIAAEQVSERRRELPGYHPASTDERLCYLHIARSQRRPRYAFEAAPA